MSVLLALVFQTAGIVWWFGGLNSRVDGQSSTIARIERKVDDLSKVVTDSTVPAAVSAAKITTLEAEVRDLKVQIEILKSRTNGARR